jgi:hypothetical protein
MVLLETLVGVGRAPEPFLTANPLHPLAVITKFSRTSRRWAIFQP